MEIVKYPDEILKTKCEEIKVFDRLIEYYVDEMIKTMIANGGIGLAANQVGLNARIFVMSAVLDNASMGMPLALINPVIVEQHGTTNIAEGCLSAPGKVRTLNRSNYVRIKFQDKIGMHREVELYGINAVCAQHEIDHLDGVFFLEKGAS